ncbi:MAG: CDP-alcohol phosphatidyltransferase family protein [Candidatus Eisenbacteria bacterium]|nr:CDP-alcohol phosphatidyltransferase family protein [Candidatus Eisenbacteria bacterium]
MTRSPNRTAIERGLVPFLREHYARSQKSVRSDEWINTFAIRPLAALFVWGFFLLRWKPVWVVWLGGLVGTAAALALVALPGERGLIWGGWLLLLKNVLDAADGQLARATGQVDRIGRFADSIADFWVNLWVPLATALLLASRFGLGPALALGLLTALCLMLQCSLFVFYQVGFLAAVGKSPVNRTDESVRPEDTLASPLERRLQALYLQLYGWQDRWIAAVDAALRRLCGVRSESARERWVSDPVALRLTSFLGLGTSLTGFALALLLRRPDLALAWVLLVLNGVALLSLLYRALVLRSRAHGTGGAS